MKKVVGVILMVVIMMAAVSAGYAETDYDLCYRLYEEEIEWLKNNNYNEWAKDDFMKTINEEGYCLGCGLVTEGDPVFANAAPEDLDAVNYDCYNEALNDYFGVKDAHIISFEMVDNLNRYGIYHIIIDFGEEINKENYPKMKGMDFYIRFCN